KAPRPSAISPPSQSRSMASPSQSEESLMPSQVRSAQGLPSASSSSLQVSMSSGMRMSSKTSLAPQVIDGAPALDLQSQTFSSGSASAGSMMPLALLL